MEMFPILTRSSVKTVFYGLPSHETVGINIKPWRRGQLWLSRQTFTQFWQPLQRQKRLKGLSNVRHQPASLVRPWHNGIGRGKVAVSRPCFLPIETLLQLLLLVGVRTSLDRLKSHVSLTEQVMKTSLPHSFWIHYPCFIILH